MWTRPQDLQARLARLWDRGELLRDGVTAQSRFPLRWAISQPTSAELTGQFDAVRAWAAHWGEARPWRLEWQAIRHRVQGQQALPAGAWIDSLDDALDCLGKQREWRRFTALLDATRQQAPSLVPWLARRPLLALELHADWAQLLAVVGWLRQHPRPAIYLRQVDLPGVHSKFIEQHRGVLAELLDLALPADCVDPRCTGVAQFASRYGFLDKPARIRFRILDPALALIPGARCPDVTLDADNFSRLQLPVQRVFITENEVNFLAFPACPGALVIFGAGYGWDALARARWLDRCRLHYWGDIDTHGFAILDQLRRHFAQVQSVLMDRATLLAHEAFWGSESSPQRADLSRLTVAEQQLYDDLRDNRIRKALRLEQEHLAYGWVRAQIEPLL